MRIPISEAIKKDFKLNHDGNRIVKDVLTICDPDSYSDKVSFIFTNASIYRITSNEEKFDVLVQDDEGSSPVTMTLNGDELVNWYTDPDAAIEKLSDILDNYMDYMASEDALEKQLKEILKMLKGDA